MTLFLVGKGSLIPKIYELIIGKFSDIVLIEDCSNGRTDITLKSFSIKNNISYYMFSDNTSVNSYMLNSVNKGDFLISFDNFLVFSGAVCNVLASSSINFHPSPLPHYKGINPVSWGLLNGELGWGFTWHRIESEIDEGEIIYQELFDMPKGSTQQSVLTYCQVGAIKSLKSIINASSIGGFRSLYDDQLYFEAIKPFSSYGFFESPTTEILNELPDQKSILPSSRYTKWSWRK